MYQPYILLISYCILLIDLYLLYKNRHNNLLLVINLIIFFFNYSICAGEYILQNSELGDDLYSTSYGNLYIDGVFLLFIFEFIRLIFFRHKIKNIEIKTQSSPILFYLIYSFLIYIAIFEVNREYSLAYEVKITPLYEYSTLLFILLLYYCGKSNFRNIIAHLLAVIFIIQDMYYGGRVTSLQLILLFLIMKHKHLMKFEYIIIFFPIATLLFTVIGVYRSNYTFDISLISTTIEEIKSTGFVQDTAICAYLASITHINAHIHTDCFTEFTSFIAFISTIFFGSKASFLFGFDPELPDVTTISQHFHWNVGGGLIFTWYYFWFGLSGVIIFTTLMFYTIKKIFYSHKDIFILIAIAITLTLPRWYLYSPLAFLRGPFFILPILYTFFNIVNQNLQNKFYTSTKYYN